MRILFISPYPPKPSGLAKYTADLVKQLRKLGNKVYVVAHKGAKGKGVFPVMEENSKEYYDKIFPIIKKIAPDIVHIQHEWGVYDIDTYNAHLIALISKIKEAKIPIAITFITSLDNFSQNMRLFNKEYRLSIVPIFYRALIDLADTSFVHTNTHANEIKKISPSAKVRQVNYPVEKNKRIKNAKTKLGLKNKKVVLLLGFINQSKNFEIVLRNWYKISKRNPKATLVFIGLVPTRVAFSDRLAYLDYLVNLITTSKAKNSIICHLQEMDKIELCKYISAADVGVIPYKTITQSAVLMDFISFGVPVAVNDIPPLTEYISKIKNGLSFKNDYDLVEQISKILHSKALSSKFFKASKKYQAANSWQKIAKKYNKEYKSLC